MGFTNITDEDVQPHRAKYKKARKKLRKLDDTLNERSKAILSSSTTDAEAIELMEIQLNPTYSDDQRNMIEDRIKKLRDELNERNKEIDILKGEASKQINHIRESITKFLDK